MISVDEILSSIVTYQDHAWSTQLKTITIGKFLNLIKEQRHNNEIIRLRNYLKHNDKKRYDQEKIRLPSVTFSGLFNNKRALESISDYNNICVIDIDNILKEKAKEIFECFNSDPYVFSYWRSPSGNGIKGLVKFEYLKLINVSEFSQCHKYAFSELHNYMKEKYSIEIDKSGSDITRLCFLSTDNALIIKKESEEFKINNQEIYVETPAHDKKIKKSESNFFVLKEHLNPDGRNNQFKRNKIQGFIKYLRRKNLSITNTYEQWYRIAYAISHTFTYNLGEKYYLQLCRLDGAQHNKELFYDPLPRQ
jgi:hypothetical protein